MKKYNNKMETIADALAEDGYIIIEELIPIELLHSLLKRVKNLELHEANIGTARDSVNTIRSDQTCWLEGISECEAELFCYFETLQNAMNRELYMGVTSYESHFSFYEKGSFYKKHSDVLRKNGVLNNSRILTSVLYLTPAWKLGDGGELLIYEDEKIVQRVEPTIGKMVLFLSEKFPHEVLESYANRYSIATWFKQR